MKILTFTSLFPSAAIPQHGVFVENRLRQLVLSGRVEARVVAPVPWVPPGLSRGRYQPMAEAPASETRHGIPVVHPRYPTIPRIGMSAAPFLMYLWTRPAVARLIADGFRFELIDAHYFYPDGVCAALLGRHFGRPVVITARGSDVNVVARYGVPCRMIRWAAGHADGVITVSRALKELLVALGVAEEHVRVLRNGVDLALFHTPENREATRARLGVAGTVLLSVGNLIRAKGHDIAIRALAALPGVTLLIAGDGPERGALAALARTLGLDERVRLLGRQPHEALPGLYGAADLLVLATQSEGWPNVLLEAMACGTPAVATGVGGIPEVVTAPAAGRLMASRTPEALAEAVRGVLAAGIDRSATRAYAEGFDWQETTAGQIALFEEILARRGRDGCPPRRRV